MGTIAAIPLVVLMQSLALPYYLAVCVLGFGVGIYICSYTSTRLGIGDHGAIVWDEIVGFAITMAFAPPGWLWLLLGFAWFRLFDIAKPWPISYLDKNLKGGAGIMVDDVVAGVFAAGALYGCQLLLAA